MANQTEVLRALSTKEEAASPKLLADELRASEATIRTDLNRLKKKGYVDGSGKEWFITDAGKAALERETEVVVTKEDVGEDELSRFTYYGQLAGVARDLIAAAVELFQNADMRSMAEVERVLAEVNVPQTKRTIWINLYRGYLRNTTPPEKQDELYPFPQPEEVRGGGEEVTTGGGRTKGEKLDYVVEGNEILRVGEDLGMFTFRQALQVVATKRGTTPQPQAGGGLKDFAEAVSTLNPNKPMTPQEVLSLINAINESRGGGNSQSQPQPGFFVDEEGNVRELKQGQPVVVKKVQRQPGKTYFVNEAGQVEEHEPGKPILIKMQPAPSGPNIPMLPFPVMDNNGQPTYDKDGKPLYTNLEPMMKYLGFQREQRRADERHDSLMGLTKTVRENLGDGISALKAAAAEAKGSSGKTPASEETQVYECSQCHTQFRIPQGDFEKAACPSCRTEYTREEVMSA